MTFALGKRVRAARFALGKRVRRALPADQHPAAATWSIADADQAWWPDAFGVRYVRTAAGAKRYGLPIGSPIVAKARKPGGGGAGGETSAKPKPGAAAGGNRAKLTPAQKAAAERHLGDGRGARIEGGQVVVDDPDRAVAALNDALAGDLTPGERKATKNLRDKIAATEGGDQQGGAPDPAADPPAADVPDQPDQSDQSESSALPDVDEAQIEERARRIDDLDIRGSFAAARARVADQLRADYPNASDEALNRATQRIMRGKLNDNWNDGDPTASPPGRGTRLALRALEREEQYRVGSRDAAATAEEARRVVGDPDRFGLRPDGSEDVDADGGLGEDTRRRLEALRAAGAAVAAEADDRIAADRAANPDRTPAEQAAADAAIRRQVLGEVRALGRGPGGSLNLNDERLSDDDLSRIAPMLDVAQDTYPTDWLAANRAHYTRLGVARERDRAAVITGAPGYARIEVGRHADDGRQQDAIVHELGHTMEDSVPGVKAAQNAFLRDRISRGPLGSRTSDETSTIYDDGDPPEIGYKDDFPSHYSGKVYSYGGRPGREQPHEILTTNMESLFGGGPSDYHDIDSQHFVLGMLAVL